MQEIDMDAVKYKLGRLIRQMDSQTFVTNIEEHYGGEFYMITFQRGCHTYTLELDGERFINWFADEEITSDMEHTIRDITEELSN
jgi:hypothetical protein